MRTMSATIMKTKKNVVRLFLAISLMATSVAGFCAENKKMDDALMEPVKSVYEHYLAIQKELAKDSLKGVDNHAGAIAKAVKADEMKMLSPQVATEANSLAAAKDLKRAREAFKPLSASLIKYLADNQAGSGVYHEAYCPMAKASWLQTEKEVRNPYYGKSMLDCGTLKN
jgi:Cu(I)/Ag(I) efflux system membrane fusion protein